MAFRLRSYKRLGRTLSLNTFTWYSLLELAEAYGWQPTGAVPANWLAGSLAVEMSSDLENPGASWESQAESGVVQLPLVEGDPLPGNYWEAGLVTLEDALNLAEALESAFLAYEPLRLPSLHVLPWLDDYDPILHRRPGIGAILELVHFCRCGAFTIEKF